MNKRFNPGLSVWAVLLASTALAVDPPHDATHGFQCASCHTPHTAPGGHITSVLGNANLCESCHVVGGPANNKALAEVDQALPWPGLPTGQQPEGTSHRWDSGPAGHIIAGTSNSSTGTIVPGGTYTGHYPKTYTITITASGNVGQARFSWTATVPPGGSGTNILTGQSVTLDEGVTVSFFDGPGISFVAGDTFNLFVRTDLRPPTTPPMAARLENGKVMCSTCHDQHSQAMAPFDPAAPAYGGPGTGHGRHNQRVNNQAAQMCEDCHDARAVTLSSQGSHPVGVGIPNTGPFKSPTQLPLDSTAQVRCLTCHVAHYAPTDDGTLARVANHTALCTDCHTLADTTSPAIHLSPTSGVLWPGGQYGSTLPAAPSSSRRGFCTNCHQPHGWPSASDPSQDYPLLLVDREEKLCLTCHDGDPAGGDIASEMAKTYRHPATNYEGRHLASEGGNPTAYGTTNRHAECEDCHNPHKVLSDGTPPTPPAVSGHLAGVSGVAVSNGAAGTVPTYSYVADAAYEYQICFKCHSSWTSQPSGQSNLAVKFNTNNPSFHPVEGQGRNTTINPGSFVNGWNASKTMYCSDCHTSDDFAVRGPHGSNNSYILKKTYNPSPNRRTVSSTELCFDCHRYDTYVNNNATNTVKGYSRFNPPAFSKGHTFHVGGKGYPCGACHETHGSTTHAHLIVTGRSPGLNNYTHSNNGGTCYPTCHGSKSYTVNY